MKKLSLIAFVLPFVVGCEAFVGLLDAEDSVARAAGKYKASTPTGTKYMSLDEALARANSFYDLELLTEQFPEIGVLGASGEDRRKVEKKREELIRRQQEQRLEYQRRLHEQHEQRITEEEQIRREQRARLEAWKANRAKFIENAPGSLKGMWAPEVKKLVGNWKDGEWDCEETDRAEFFSVENFYKVLGKPERISLVENTAIHGGSSYYLYYNCKGGLVQIEVYVEYFDQGTVHIRGLNIF